MAFIPVTIFKTISCPYIRVYNAIGTDWKKHSAGNSCSRITSCSNGTLVTFGVVSVSPETGYGYMKTAGSGSVLKLAQFVEKSDLPAATEYLADGSYYKTNVAEIKELFLFVANRDFAAI
ncbi:sugar phosphate nucleotidyltransferase [Treponema brennaborense]|uniref:sugar phosphate nucleotidyltransferase n=1 Tax=Treponema brennaborense TaxID=81028 RepID=UPI001C067B7D|nr:sugar phosphate nucleotidyltransferase [Treponema brennaborense]